MRVDQSIELFVAINFLAIGLSHFLHPKSWVDFFTFLHSKNTTGNIINALIALAMGSVILSFHLIWKWPKVWITLYGISQVLKGFIYLIKPSIGMSSIARVKIERANKFRWTGLLMFLFSLSIFYNFISNNII